MAGLGPGYLEGAERAVEEGIAARQKREAEDRLLQEKILASGGLSPEDTLRALQDEQEANPGLIQRGLENLPRLWHRRAPAPSVPDPTLQTRGQQPPAQPAPRSQGWEPKYERARQNLQLLKGDMTTPFQRAEEAAQTKAQVGFDNEIARDQAAGRIHLKDAEALSAYNLAHPKPAPSRGFVYTGADGKAHEGTVRGGLDYDDAGKLMQNADVYEHPHQDSASLLNVGYQTAVDEGKKPTPSEKAAHEVAQQVLGQKSAEQAQQAKLAFKERMAYNVTTTIPALKAALQSLAKMKSDVKALNNSNIPALNWGENFAGLHLGNDTALSNFNQDRDNVNANLNKPIGYTGFATSIISQLNASRTPSQLYQAIDRASASIQSQITNMQYLYNNPDAVLTPPKAPAPRAPQTVQLSPAQVAARNALLGGG